MDDNRRSYLQTALFAVGVAFLVVYPLMQLWPSGWAWTPGQHEYEQMIVGVYATLGIFLMLGVARARGASQFDLVHGVVERRPRRHHGGAGGRRLVRARASGRRRAGALSSWPSFSAC